MYSELQGGGGGGGAAAASSVAEAKQANMWSCFVGQLLVHCVFSVVFSSLSLSHPLDVLLRCLAIGFRS